MALLTSTWALCLVLITYCHVGRVLAGPVLLNTAWNVEQGKPFTIEFRLDGGSDATIDLMDAPSPDDIETIATLTSEYFSKHLVGEFSMADATIGFTITDFENQTVHQEPDTQ